MPTPQEADFFFVPLLDGTYGVGQVISTSGTILVGLTRRKADPKAVIPPITGPEFIAFLKITSDAFASAAWPLGGFDQLPHAIRPETIVAQEGHDQAVVEAFLSACHGLYPWDGFGELFETMLRPGVDRKGWA